MRLVEASIQKIEANPSLCRRLVQNVARWPNPRLRSQWQRRLQQPWPQLRAQLLADSDEGAALRQDAPLAGILSPVERARIMREFSMTRAQLEHIVRAAGGVTNEQAILVLGSQAILGTFPSPPSPLDVSREADVCPWKAPEKADLISGAIGEISQFDSTFGYYAHGLPPESCPLPSGWETRLVIFQNQNTERMGTGSLGLYTRGGTVFTAATTDWAHGLTGDDPVVERITRNILDRLSQ